MILKLYVMENQVSIYDDKGIDVWLRWTLALAHEASLLSIEWWQVGQYISCNTKRIGDAIYTRYMGQWKTYFVRTKEIEQALFGNKNQILAS